MRRGAIGAVLGCVLLVGACSEDPSPVVPPGVVEETPAPFYDASLEPSAAALALVPEDATVLVVTDYDGLRLQLEQSELTSESPARERQRFWRSVERDVVALSSGVLRANDRLLRQKYGFTQDDVVWEARFGTPSGAGWVLRLRDDLDLSGVERAIEDGVAPLTGAVVDTARSLLTLDATDTPATSWAADPDLVVLVGAPALSTYVDTACLPEDVAFGPVDAAGDDAAALAAAADAARLDELGAFSVSYGVELVTVRLGPAREDAFDRAGLTADLVETPFTSAYLDAVADPSGGRIGYRLGDLDVAESLALQRRLPFAVCAS